MRLARAWVVALLVGMLALVGCTEGGGDAGGVAVEEADGRAGVGDSGGAAEPGVAENAADAPAEGDEDRQVITTGTLALVVEDPRAAADEVAAVVGEAGGRVDERSEHDSPEGQPSGRCCRGCWCSPSRRP